MREYEPKIKIDVTRDVHEHLRGLKQQGDSFNDVLRRELLEKEVPNGESTQKD